MNRLIGIKKQLVHLHVSKQATKTSKITLHFLGYNHNSRYSYRKYQLYRPSD